MGSGVNRNIVHGIEKRQMVFLSVGEGVEQAVAPRNVTVPGTQAAATSASRAGCLLQASLLSYAPLAASGTPILLMLSSHLFAQPCCPSTFLFMLVAENWLCFSRSLPGCWVRQGGRGCCI